MVKCLLSVLGGRWGLGGLDSEESCQYEVISVWEEHEAYKGV